MITTRARALALAFVCGACGCAAPPATHVVEGVDSITVPLPIGFAEAITVALDVLGPQEINQPDDGDTARLEILACLVHPDATDERPARARVSRPQGDGVLGLDVFLDARARRVFTGQRMQCAEAAFAALSTCEASACADEVVFDVARTDDTDLDALALSLRATLVVTSRRELPDATRVDVVWRRGP